ncbi:MAG: putative scaffold protein [Prokaryotic dsDNA virus sp.]|nr:MAG: putative scaffold protein [Prokaryotic dsDNA virus sp.]|tara:strand:- start:20607 stop:21089 length:483 start_codon:yes stop_codon:yes gene_type:complete
MSLDIRPAEGVDIEIIAADMRPADLAEIEATGTVDPYLALSNAMELSMPSCFTMTADDLPIAMFGISSVELIPDFGSIWLLGTEEIERHPTAFLRLCKSVLPRLMTPYDMVFNLMDVRNELHVKFVKWLGFTFIRERPFGPEGMPFYEFALINKNRRSHV